MNNDHRNDDPITHEAMQNLHQDVQRDAARAREQDSSDTGVDELQDAEKTETEEGVNRPYDSH